MSLPKSAYLSDVWRDGIFNNKVIFCTGGAGSICSAQVRAMVHLGANACIVGRNVEKTERVAKDIATARSGAKVLGIGAVDVRNFDSLKAAVDKCVKELGGVDFVIAGAAGNFLASIDQLSVNAFKSVMDIDVLGSFNTLKATVPHLLESAAKHKSDGETPSPTGTGGRIIFVSATIHYTAMALQTHVSVAKAGVDSLSNSVAIEFGPRGITSNVIAPGPIKDTEGINRLARAQDVAARHAQVPLGRYGTVKEVADATVYIFSDSGNFVNGSTVVVDGAAWRNHSTDVGSGFQYPDFLISGEEVTGVSGLKKQSKI
ncbi:hypothetical protein AJ80_08032 [Polytolypa hystricis UAMH7299]|uniref:2,4-dienoyl-CoA reductase [(3E)-enoyl-CoA-producing] n=1 Tax=Polytolypa hystricis (strain UAMH7299) TaxID=1447883 RepID=A0A2B7XDM9_POLH7|nr:hypothetical protein AJ80_08032 [Polytolypa hystricis UAMH7299]